MFGDKKYHDKTIRTKYKGKLKPFAQRVKDALESGKAKYVKTLPKNIYLYELVKKKKKTRQSSPNLKSKDVHNTNKNGGKQ